MHDNGWSLRLAGSSDSFAVGKRTPSSAHSRDCSSWPPKTGASECTCGTLDSGKDYGGDIDDFV